MIVQATGHHTGQAFSLPTVDAPAVRLVSSSEAPCPVSLEQGQVASVALHEQLMLVSVPHHGKALYKNSLIRRNVCGTLHCDKSAWYPAGATIRQEVPACGGEGQGEGEPVLPNHAAPRTRNTAHTLQHETPLLESLSLSGPLLECPKFAIASTGGCISEMFRGCAILPAHLVASCVM